LNIENYKNWKNSLTIQSSIENIQLFTIKKLYGLKTFAIKSTKFMTKKLKGAANEDYGFKQTDEPQLVKPVQCVLYG
jgi:hypothetical protein